MLNVTPDELGLDYRFYAFNWALPLRSHVPNICAMLEKLVQFYHFLDTKFVKAPYSLC